uniref:Putative secreted protein n=1 Tax=Anopheles darlingi TaxID=43151 RepID=A0A2M4DED3_ANODA
MYEVCFTAQLLLVVASGHTRSIHRNLNDHFPVFRFLLENLAHLGDQVEKGVLILNRASTVIVARVQPH